MHTTHNAAQVQAAANVRVRLHDSAVLKAVEPRFEELSKAAKREVCSYVEPVEEIRECNTTVDNLHTTIAELLDPNTSSSATASHLALGDDDTSPASGNTSLNNEVYRTDITDSSVTGTDLFTSTFLDTSEANGNTIRELGLAESSTGSASDILNHSLITPTIQKTSDNTATFDVSLTFTAT